jgi:prevent-host-death family protein
MTRVVDKGKFISSTMWARNFSKYLNMVKEEGELFIVKNSRPEAVVLDVDEYNRLTKFAELIEDLEIAQMIDEREESEAKYSLSDVIKKLGFAKEDLR